MPLWDAHALTDMVWDADCVGDIELEMDPLFVTVEVIVADPDSLTLPETDDDIVPLTEPDPEEEALCVKLGEPDDDPENDAL